ncbi:MAG: hypothetical protein M3Q32_06550 [Pseudomonadota bacterium]|nr:hypothetical protein [Pseudomonadota bacterium]
MNKLTALALALAMGSSVAMATDASRTNADTPSKDANAPSSTPAEGKSYSGEAEKQQTTTEGQAGPAGSASPS